MDCYYEVLVKRADQGDTPYNLRNCAFIEEFDREKIIYRKINTNGLNNSYLDNNSYICISSAFILTGKHLGYLTAFLNSKLFNYCYKNVVNTIGSAKLALGMYMDEVYIKNVSEDEDKIFKKLVYEIQGKKKNKEDTTKLETQIDNMIFELYGLTDEEIEEVEKEVKNYIYN